MSAIVLWVAVGIGIYGVIGLAFAIQEQIKIRQEERNKSNAS